MRKRRSYGSDFKEYILNELQDRSKIMELSRKYDIPNQTISEWRKDAEIIVNRRRIRYTEKDVYKLEQENKILREELKALKKAMRFVKR